MCAGFYSISRLLGFTLFILPWSLFWSMFRLRASLHPLEIAGEIVVDRMYYPPMDFNGSTNYSPLRVGIDIPDITGTTDITDYRYIPSFQLNIRFSPRQSFIHQRFSNFWAWPGFKLVASLYSLPKSSKFFGKKQTSTHA